MTTKPKPVTVRTQRLREAEPAQWTAPATATHVSQCIAGVACVLVGVTLILNIHPIGDGMWFWYALDLRHGVRLYRDLHLALQPLYVLGTAAGQTILGTSWLASKAFPLLQLLVFTWLLVQIGRFVPWRPWQRALLAFCAFLFVLQPSTYRFDDYHVTSDIFTLGAVLLLLHLGSRPRSLRAILPYTFGMGLCCGMCAMTRLNDGAALAVATGLAVLLLYPRRALATLAAVSAGTVSAWALVLATARDTPRSWWHYSVASAGQIKGGTEHIFYTPLLLPFHLALNSLSWKTPVALAVLGGVSVATHGVQQRARKGLAWKSYAVAWIALLLTLAFPLVHRAQVQTPLELVVRVAVLLLLCAAAGVTCWVVVRMVQSKRALLRPAFALLLFPLMHLLGGALTASNALPDPYLSLAMLMLTAPLLLSEGSARTWTLPILANVGLLAAVIVAGKVQHPYYWWTYDDGPIYRDRVWYRHPDLGPMYIERPQLALMRELCARVKATEPSAGLLSMPFPYANYFCAVPPWRDYVQTWYDTSSAETIHTLVHRLQTAPPRWIAYEYDPVAVVGHEITYHRGKPIAHRALMNLVVERIASGDWTVRQHSCARMSEWLLIETVRVPDADNVLRSGFQPKGGLCR